MQSSNSTTKKGERKSLIEATIKELIDMTAKATAQYFSSLISKTIREETRENAIFSTHLLKGP